jgi:hypothetical protein
MNKWELIEDVEKIGIYNLNLFGNKVKSIPTKTAIKLIKQLDEPEKPVVPQFVADVIEGAREQSAELEDAFEYARDAAFRGEMSGWFMKLENRNTFARAWLDGCEVEKEKRYRVRAKGVCFNGCLIFEKINKTWLFSSIYEIDHQRGSHTRKQLEDGGFGEVFNSTLFEVEEVE